MSRSSQLARQRAREALLVQQRVEARRRRMLWAGGSLATILVLVMTMVVVRLSMADEADAQVPSGQLPANVVQALQVDPATLNAIGRGSATSWPQRLSGQPALTADSKPLVLYIGGEYCPFCAAQRWALVVALSRFGTFIDLKAARSASDDIYPSTATVSFYGAEYTSEYLSFQGVELATSERQGGQYTPLQSLTAAQEQVMRTYNAPPYVPARSAGAVPFVDFGNQFLMTGSAFSPELLAGMDQEEIAAALADPNSEVAKAALGAANALTGVLCVLTGGQPANVCTSPSATAFPEVSRGA
ncbi:MAG TPA: DUF929 family protein [Micromonosporaceae bacterium]